MNTTGLSSISTVTPDGEFHIIIDDQEIARVSGYGKLDDLIRRLPEALRGIAITSLSNHVYADYVAAYYQQDHQALDNILREQTGSAFQQKVWQAISAIPYGSTVSYKQLAQSSGNAAAIRAAGTICGMNRLILLVPCHRVLKSDGSIGSYLYGPAIKSSLLKLEGAVT